MKKRILAVLAVFCVLTAFGLLTVACEGADPGGPVKPGNTGDQDELADLLDIYTVTFDSDEGTPVPPQEVEDGKTATRPDDPTRDDLFFDGWYWWGELFDFSTPIEINTTLKAKWREDSHAGHIPGTPAYTPVEGDNYIVWGYESGNVIGTPPFFRDSTYVANNGNAETERIVITGNVPENKPQYVGGYALRWDIDASTGPDGTVGIGGVSSPTQIPKKNGRNPTSIGVWIYLDNLTIKPHRIMLGLSPATTSTTTNWVGANIPPGGALTIPQGKWVFMEFSLNPDPPAWVADGNPRYPGSGPGLLNWGQTTTMANTFTSSSMLYFPNDASNAARTTNAFIAWRHTAGNLSGRGSFYIGSITFFYNYNTFGTPSYPASSIDDLANASGLARMLYN